MPRYTFLESKLPRDFAQKKVEMISKQIEKGNSFTILGMPGTGVSSFLRFLTVTKPLKQKSFFAFIDIYDLINLDRTEYLKQILKNLDIEEIPNDEQQLLELGKKRLLELSTQHEKVVIICNRYDQLSPEFTRTFLANIFQLAHVAPKKIVFIFTSNVPLYELCPEAISGNSLNFYSNFFYMNRFEPKDIKSLLSLSDPFLDEDSPRTKKILALTNGHLQLAQMMNKSESIENPLLDRFVRLALSEIYETLNHGRKNIVQKLSQKKEVKEVDQYLLSIGLIEDKGHEYRFFTPLFREYLLTYVAFNLPSKERRLFELLKKNAGKMVSKDELFVRIWPKNSEETSDWALNALIYRLRKNPQFSSRGFEIISIKKEGYMLVKN